MHMLSLSCLSDIEAGLSTRQMDTYVCVLEVGDGHEVKRRGRTSKKDEKAASEIGKRKECSIPESK